MPFSYEHVLNQLQNIEPAALRFYRGIEKEGLRVNGDTQIALTAHNEQLGSALTHPNITTDYSESLLEFITPVSSEPKEVLSMLEELHGFTSKQIKDEHIWSFSMPGIIKDELDVPIAQFGSSNVGQLKHVYRHGLWHRYGRKMQCIAGLHYNFSVDESLWTFLGDLYQQPVNKDLMSQQYFGLIRNFRRHAWLLLYLFGASPALDASFIEQDDHGLQKWDDETLFSPYATSLRMSGLGYQNNAQDGLFVCFNGLSSYTDTLKEAMAQSVPAYEEIGVEQNGQYKQLNTNLLQIENEYYSDIRPKRNSQNGEKPLTALNQHGVEYIEVRCLDLNPFTPLGIDEQQIHFMDLFLAHCLLSPSAALSEAECREVEQNHREVVVKGRDPEFKLKRMGQSISLQEWGQQVIEDMKPLADILDAKKECGQYTDALESMKARLLDSALTPSAQILAGMKQSQLSYKDYAFEQTSYLATQYAQTLTSEQDQKWREVAKDSLLKQRDTEQLDDITFADYLAQYASKV